MATIEQVPTTPEAQEIDVSRPLYRPLDSLLARAYTLNWEAIFYIALFGLTVLTRFVNLGDRVMSHDESLHVKFSWDLYKNGNFQHTPLMHGPLIFHATALMYFLFGDNDFSARLYPAILGTIMVFMPKLLFERWLGKFGAMATSLLIFISPMLLFHARYIREDTPSIFYTLLMIYAIFAYLDGAKPRQARYLILLSGAMLLSLASKEVAFMYVAIFGAVLTLVWLLQVAQGIRTGLTHPMVGWVIGGVLAVIVWAGLSIGIGAGLSGVLFRIGGAELSPVLLAVPVAIVLAIIFFILVRPARNLLGAIGLRGNSILKIVTAGIILGTVAALAITVFLSVIQPKDIWKPAAAPAAVSDQVQTAPAAPTGTVVDQALLSRLIMWTAIMVLVLALVVIVPALVAFARSPRMPWADIAMVFVIALLTCILLVVLEERTRNVPNVSVDRPAGGTTVTSTDSGRHNEFILAAWVIGVAVIGGIAFLRIATPFFEEMKRYPVFDILILMATLILPWLSAVPIFLAGYPLDGGGYPTADTISAGILGTIPFVAVAVVAGLAWNPQVWLVCNAVFYSIFVFFFTTVFTNFNGIFTGLVQSLGYWLAQQGVKRGSQPQYYYIVTQLPVYEYLPVIGSIVAGIVGMLGVWRFRAARFVAADEAAALTGEDTPNESNQQEIMLGDDGEIVADVMSPANETMISSVNATMTLDVDGNPVISPEAVVEPEGPTEDELRSRIPAPEWIHAPSFLGFVGIWAVLILMALTMSGEKMPWLTTHLTTPLIFITGAYLGSILEKVDWRAFMQRGWAMILLMPIFLIALANVVGPYFVGTRPFGGLERDDLLRTFTWLGAVLLAGLVAYVVYRIWKQIGTSQAVKIGVLGVFFMLSLLTLRTAFMAAYINYDYATEFLVYAHGAPANKTVMSVIEDISKRTTDGMGIRVAYDNEVSWPGSWYFRNYPNARFLGDTSGATDLDTYVAVVVGSNNSRKIESQLADKFYKYDYIRLWWPMQEYFDLNVARIDNVFSGGTDLPAGWFKGSELRQGIWNIWWSRDYSAYGKATGKTFDVSQWPVSDHMVFWVRKDVAAQVWDFGTGSTKVTGLPDDPFKNLRCDTCAANAVFGAAGSIQGGQLNHPRGLTVGPDGNLYVADSQNARITIFDSDGKYLRNFGIPGSVEQQGGAPGGTFREPWGVAVAPDGTIYVADTWNHRVQVFDNNGKFIRLWGQFEQVAPGSPNRPDGFWGPRDIALDAQGRVFVADTGNKRVRVYDGQGKFLYNIGSGGADMGQLNEPVGIAINQQTSEIFVADTWNKRINVYDLAGAFRRSWTIQGWSATTETGSRPFLALDKSGTRLFVTDPDSARVLVFDTSGVPILSFGKLGSASNYSTSQFGTLGGVTVDKAGRLFLSDAGAGRILRFAPESLPGVMPQNPAEAPEQIGTPSATPVEF